jgi:hypothetical protein
VFSGLNHLSCVRSKSVSDYIVLTSFFFLSFILKILFYHFRSESSVLSGQNEVTASTKIVTTAASPSSATVAPPSGSDFTDLNYVLRKNNNYVVGQRLAVTASAEAIAGLDEQNEMCVFVNFCSGFA